MYGDCIRLNSKCSAAASTAHGYAVVDLAKGALIFSNCTLTFPAEPSAADASTNHSFYSYRLCILLSFTVLVFRPRFDILSMSRLVAAGGATTTGEPISPRRRATLKQSLRQSFRRLRKMRMSKSKKQEQAAAAAAPSAASAPAATAAAHQAAAAGAATAGGSPAAPGTLFPWTI